MATRTSSPPGSRSRSTPSRGAAKGSSKGSSSTRSRRTKPTRKPASRRRRSTAGRPAPRAVRSGPGPVFRFFAFLGRGVAAAWLAIAHGIGAVARGIGRSARELDPEHRRDGVGLLLIGLGVIAAAAVWWQLPGGPAETVRTIVAGSVGKVGWLVPVMLAVIGVRNMRDPESNGPAGRQLIGWLALAFGVLGIVHVAAGNPQPALGDASPLQDGGGAIGYVVSSLLLDLLRSPYVVVPLLALVAFFGVLVITATPGLPGAGEAGRAPRPAARARAGRGRRGRRPRGHPAHPTRRRRGLRPRRRRPRATRPTTARSWRIARSAAAGPRPACPRRPRTTTPTSSCSRLRTRRSRSASSSSRSPATSPTPCRATRCSSPARCTRPARRPATTSSGGSPRCSTSSPSTPS